MNLRGKQVDLRGRRFGRIVVLNKEGKDRRGNYLWRCRCDCETTKVLTTTRLIAGGTKDCGCVFRKKITTHGLSGTKTYIIWTHLKQRCLNPAATGWENYGARGITVCDRWLSYENFIADMGEAPQGRSLDRINVNGNYEPDNCRWATKAEQENNTRRNKFVMLDGVEMPLTKAIKHLRETAYKKDASSPKCRDAGPCL